MEENNPDGGVTDHDFEEVLQWLKGPCKAAAGKVASSSEAMNIVVDSSGLAHGRQSNVMVKAALDRFAVQVSVFADFAVWFGNMLWAHVTSSYTDGLADRCEVEARCWFCVGVLLVEC